MSPCSLHCSLQVVQSLSTWPCYDRIEGYDFDWERKLILKSLDLEFCYAGNRHRHTPHPGLPNKEELTTKFTSAHFSICICYSSIWKTNEYDRKEGWVMDLHQLFIFPDRLPAQLIKNNLELWNPECVHQPIFADSKKFWML